MPTRLTRTIALLYRMESADTETLYNQLLEARKRAWKTALELSARIHGCRQVPNAPRREDLDELKRMSREDAESITQTWNRDVIRQIEKLYEANIRGNRQYYFSNLERWNAQRNTWKLPQIALVTETTTAEYARERFRKMNYPGGQKYVFDGAPPTCKDCVRRFAAGVVDASYIRRFPTPRHINCPHTWRVLRPPRLRCDQIWLG